MTKIEEKFTLNIIDIKSFDFLTTKTINFLNQSEIAVVPSRWEEPFGRTSLEASSCGCATIISNRGGLTETTDAAVILKNLNSNDLYLEIKINHKQ